MATLRLAAVLALHAARCAAARSPPAELAWEASPPRGRSRRPRPTSPPTATRPRSRAATRPREPHEAAETVDGYQRDPRAHEGRRHHGDQVQAAEGLGHRAAAERARSAQRQVHARRGRQGACPSKGTLAAQIKTSMGSFYCDLFEDKAPVTVANFVGLARGLRKFWDAEKRAWVARPYYDGTTFHRVDPRLHDPGRRSHRHRHAAARLHDPGRAAPEPAATTRRPAVHGQPRAEHQRGAVLHHRRRRRRTSTGATRSSASASRRRWCSASRACRSRARRSNRPLTPVTIEKVEIRRVAGRRRQVDAGEREAAADAGRARPGPRRAGAERRSVETASGRQSTRRSGHLLGVPSAVRSLLLLLFRLVARCGGSADAHFGFGLDRAVLARLKRSFTCASMSSPVSTLRTSDAMSASRRKRPTSCATAFTTPLRMSPSCDTRCDADVLGKIDSLTFSSGPRPASKPCAAAPAGCGRARCGHRRRVARAQVAGSASGASGSLSSSPRGRRWRALRVGCHRVPLWKSRPGTCQSAARR